MLDLSLSGVAKDYYSFLPVYSSKKYFMWVMFSNWSEDALGWTASIYVAFERPLECTMINPGLLSLVHAVDIPTVSAEAASF